MTRTESISGRAAFARLVAHGRRVRRSGMTVLVAARGDGGPARLGIAVRTRTAVERNRARRRVRAAFRDCAPALAGCDVLVRGDRCLARMPFDRLRSELCAGTSDALRDAR